MRNHEKTTERWLSTEEVAERLGLSVKTIREAIGRGDLDAFRPGGGSRSPLRVAEASVDAWIKSRPATPQAQDLADIDWSQPKEGLLSPEQGITVCDEYTSFIPVHSSRLSDFYAMRSRLQRERNSASDTTTTS
ncbi:MAG: helix-turn-helix domain-containing protein [Nocardioidaceae bacterium]